MKPITLLFAGLFAFAASAVAAEDYKLGSLEISQPWARATPKGASVAAGYMKITNTGTTPDRLIGGSSPVAESFEIHEMTIADNVMKMRPLANGLEIKPGKTAELKPGSYHVMFVGLKQQLQLGEHMKGTLVFEKAGPIDIEYTVQPIGGPRTQGAAPGRDMGAEHDMSAGHDMPAGHDMHGHW